jgi:hypothetical protein
VSRLADAEQFFRPGGKPAVAGIGLTLWAVPIAAGAVRDGAIAALGALIQVPAQ